MKDNVKTDKMTKLAGVLFWLPALILIVHFLYSLWIVDPFDIAGLQWFVSEYFTGSSLDNGLGHIAFAQMVWNLALSVSSAGLLVMFIRRSPRFHWMFNVYLWLLLFAKVATSVTYSSLMGIEEHWLEMRLYDFSVLATMVFYITTASSEKYARAFRPQLVDEFKRRWYNPPLTDQNTTDPQSDLPLINSGPRGIGGWFVLPMTFLALTILVLAQDVVVSLENIVEFTFLASQVSEAGAIFFVVQLSCFVPLLAGILGLVLLAKRSRHLPPVLTFYFFLYALYDLISIAWFYFIIPEQDRHLEALLVTPTALIALLRYIAVLAIAIVLALYLRVSKRVKNTFGRESRFDGEEGQPTTPAIN